MYLLVEVGQPVHALELVPLEFAVEDAGLRDFLPCVDRRVGEAVALSEPGAGARGRAGDAHRRAAAVLRLLVEHARLRREIRRLALYSVCVCVWDEGTCERARAR